MNLKQILHEICKIKMSKEVEKFESKVMELEFLLKQERRYLEEAQNENLKYKSQMGKILKDQSLLEENITNKNINVVKSNAIFEKTTSGFEVQTILNNCSSEIEALESKYVEVIEQLKENIENLESEKIKLNADINAMESKYVDILIQDIENLESENIWLKTKIEVLKNLLDKDLI